MELRIQQGQWHGRRLAIPPKVKGHSCFTPALIKSAVFDILRSRCHSGFSEWSFFDLCAGSGQMAIESLSQGFVAVHACEIDQGRFRFLIQTIKEQNYNIRVLRRDYLKCVPLVLAAERTVVYLDPPYTFWQAKEQTLDQFLDSVLKNRPESPNQELLVFIQAPAKATIFDPISDLPCKLTHRVYRSHQLIQVEF